MEPKSKNKRPWYKKKRYLIPLSIVCFLFILSLGNSSNQNAVESIPPSVNKTPSFEQWQETSNNSSSQSELSNDNYYTNSRGNQVHSPAYSNSIPSEATAKCSDGTYSFSQSRQGTCSHHGGVSRWY